MSQFHLQQIHFSQIRLKDCRLSLHFKNKTDVKKALFSWIWGYAERAKTRCIIIEIKIKTACFHKKNLYVDVESTKNALEFFSHFFIKSVNWWFSKIFNEDYLIGSYGKFLKKKTEIKRKNWNFHISPKINSVFVLAETWYSF